jgi:hypothetical protein
LTLIEDAVDQRCGREEADMQEMHLSLRAALAENRLEDFVRQAMARGLEFSRGSEFERGLALLLVQRKQNRERADRPVS